MSKKFASDFVDRGTVKLTDKLLIHNIDTGVTEYTTVQKLFVAIGYNGTKYWSCAGIHFRSTNPATDNITLTNSGSVIANADGITFLTQVFLPHGAVITNVIMYGNAAASAEEWQLCRITLSNKAWGDMANANINTADNTIQLATVDNSLYSYYFYTTSLDTNDEIYGIRIIYTI